MSWFIDLLSSAAIVGLHIHIIKRNPLPVSATALTKFTFQVLLKVLRVDETWTHHRPLCHSHTFFNIFLSAFRFFYQTQQPHILLHIFLLSALSKEQWLDFIDTQKYFPRGVFTFVYMTLCRGSSSFRGCCCEKTKKNKHKQLELKLWCKQKLQFCMLCIIPALLKKQVRFVSTCQIQCR